jgi:hypothetical protein
MTKPSLPRSLSQTWPGGFVFEGPRLITRVAAGAGSVLAAGDALYLLSPGATSFGRREIPPDVGDVVAVAVEPRRSARLAVAGMDAVLIFDGKRVDRVHLAGQGVEVSELAWALSDRGDALHLYALLSDGTVLRLAPGTGDIDELELPPVDAIAADEAGELVFACYNEGCWSLDIYTRGGHLHEGRELGSQPRGAEQHVRREPRDGGPNDRSVVSVWRGVGEPRTPRRFRRGRRPPGRRPRRVSGDRGSCCGLRGG